LNTKLKNRKDSFELLVTATIKDDNVGENIFQVANAQLQQDKIKNK